MRRLVSFFLFACVTTTLAAQEKQTSSLSALVLSYHGPNQTFFPGDPIAKGMQIELLSDEKIEMISSEGTRLTLVGPGTLLFSEDSSIPKLLDGYLLVETTDLQKVGVESGDIDISDGQVALYLDPQAHALTITSYGATVELEHKESGRREIEPGKQLLVALRPPIERRSNTNSRDYPNQPIALLSMGSRYRRRRSVIWLKKGSGEVTQKKGKEQTAFEELAASVRAEWASTRDVIRDVSLQKETSDPHKVLSNADLGAHPAADSMARHTEEIRDSAEASVRESVSANAALKKLSGRQISQLEQQKSIQSEE